MYRVGIELLTAVILILLPASAHVVLLLTLRLPRYIFLRNAGPPPNYTSLQPRIPHSLTVNSKVRDTVAPAPPFLTSTLDAGEWSA